MPPDPPDHDWFIFWDNELGRLAVHCRCGDKFLTLRAWSRHAQQVKVQ